jgi:predicted nucleic acid-binding protein
MIFVDSNIWLYGYGKAESERRKHEIALAIAERDDICLSSQVVNEVVSNILRKKLGSEQYAAEIVDELYGDYTVLEIIKSDIVDAGRLRGQYRFSYWDSLIVSTALRTQATELYSEDLQHGLVVRQTLTIRNPFLL